jgi:hypothetical protein
MSDSSTTGVPVGGATTGPGAGPPQTSTLHQQQALKAIDALTAALQFFPNLQTAFPDQAQAVRRRLNTDPKVIVLAAAAVEQSSELQSSANRYSVPDARDKAQYIEAYRPVVNAAKAMVADMEFSVNVVQAEATKEALDVYDLAKSLSRNAKSRVFPHVQNLKSVVKRKGHKGLKKPVTPTTPSSPTAPAPQPITAGEEVPKKAA